MTTAKEINKLQPSWPMVIIIIAAMYFGVPLIDGETGEPKVPTVTDITELVNDVLIERYNAKTNHVVKVQSVPLPNPEIQEVKSLIKDLHSMSAHAIIQKQNEQHLQTKWINSPVTQDWVFDKKTQTWRTTLPYNESMRSAPSIEIGLREDGIVVWKDNSKF